LARVSASGDDPLLWGLYAAIVALTVLAAMPTPRAAQSWWWPPPAAALVLWGVVAVASVTRLIVPSVVELFRREPVRTRDGGEWWRVLTAGLVEDGGVAVTVANLVLLAVVAVAAVRVWGWYRAVALFVVGQLLWGLFTTFVSPSVGAGTSGATLALAASIAGLWPVTGARRPLLLVSATVFVLGGLLLVLGDAHGVAVLTGMLLGAVLGTVLPPRRRAAHGAGTLGEVSL